MNKIAAWWCWLGRLTFPQVIRAGVVVAVLMELLTSCLRFGLHWQVTRDTIRLAAYTFGYRIHHGYLGILLFLIVPWLSRGGWRNLLLVLGIGLVLSDLIHHVAVLWPITGSPHFDIRYPSWKPP